MKKLLTIFLLTVSLAVTGIGCSNQTEQKTTNANSNGSKEKKVDTNQTKLDMIKPFAYSNIDGLNVKSGTYISIIGREGDSAYSKAVESGATKAIEDINKEKGYEGKDKIKLVYSAPTDASDVDQQINILDEETARYPVAIAIAAADMQACEVQFDLASENNISIVTFDTGSNYKGVMANIGTDSTQSINKIIEELSKKVSEKSAILVVSGDSKLKAEEDRRNAFTEAMKNNPNQYTFPEPMLMDKSEKSLKEILKENPDIKGIVTTGSKATKEVASTLTDMKEKGITVMGYDLSKESGESLKDGYIDGIVEQNPYGMGYASVVACIRSALDMGNEATIDTGYNWITKSNVDDADAALY